MKLYTALGIAQTIYAIFAIFLVALSAYIIITYVVGATASGGALGVIGGPYGLAGIIGMCLAALVILTVEISTIGIVYLDTKRQGDGTGMSIVKAFPIINKFYIYYRMFAG